MTWLALLILVALILAHRYHPKQRQVRRVMRIVVGNLEQRVPKAYRAPPSRSRSRILATDPRMTPYRPRTVPDADR